MIGGPVSVLGRSEVQCEMVALVFNFDLTIVGDCQLDGSPYPGWRPENTTRHSPGKR